MLVPYLVLNIDKADSLNPNSSIDPKEPDHTNVGLKSSLNRTRLG